MFKSTVQTVGGRIFMDGKEITNPNSIKIDSNKDEYLENIPNRASLNFNGTTIVGHIGDNANVKCLKSTVVIVGDIGSYANIDCAGSAEFLGNISSYTEITCKGSASFSGDIGSYVSITCSGTPKLTGNIGKHVKINGESFKHPTRANNHNNGLCFAGVDGDLEVGGNSNVNISVSAFAFVPSLAMLNNHDNSDNSSLQINRTLSHFPNAEVSIEELEKIFIKESSVNTKQFMQRFVDKKSHNQIIDELKLTADELKPLEELKDPITKKIIDRPFLLYNQAYDLKSILKLKGVEPSTNNKFSPLEVVPDHNTVNKFEEIIKKIKEDRLDLAKKNSSSNVSARAPGGPSFN